VDRVALLARMTAEEEEPAVRRAAFELLLAQSDPGRALRLATAHLDDPQPPLRLRALQAAVKLDPASGLSHALRAANDPAPEVRAFVARFCASRDEPEARRCLQALVDDAADSVRLTAKDRLGLVAEPAPPDLQPSVTLADALADPRREVRADAVRVLASESETAGDRAPLLERVLLEETDADLRLDALSSPGGAAAAVAVLQALLRDPDPRMRARAAQHLGQRQAAETIGDLTARLTDSGAEVRACARAALDRIDPEWAGREAAQRREPEIVEALTQAMPEVRAAAAAALALIAEARTERPTRQPESARTNR
jgi:HEAT repeat protein